MRLLIQLVLRMPKVAGVVFLLALVALASTLSYAGFLVVGIVAQYLGTGRFVAGLLLGLLFARLPWVRKGKLRTVGLLPRNARLPLMLVLLVFSLMNFLYRGALVPVLFLGLATTFLLTHRWIRRTLFNRALSFLFKPPSQRGRAGSTDKAIIDVDVREKKD